MNLYERNAWATLVSLGAAEITIGGKRALDVRTIRVRSARRMATFCYAFREVVGRSGSNCYHTDRYGQPVFVVTDERPPTSGTGEGERG